MYPGMYQEDDREVVRSFESAPLADGHWHLCRLDVQEEDGVRPYRANGRGDGATARLAARTRTADTSSIHGDIWIIKMDSHPSHRSLDMRDFMAGNSTGMPLSPPGVHEGVADAELAFSHVVP